jgi:hypothetical protein
MSLLGRLVAPGPKRILALDGSGVRGAVTFGFLARTEASTWERHGCLDFVLATVVGHTERGIQYGVEAARLPAAFNLPR